MSGEWSLGTVREECPTGGEASDDRGIGCGAGGAEGVESAQNQPMVVNWVPKRLKRN